MKEGTIPDPPKEGWTAQGICSGCNHGNFSGMADGKSIVTRCKIMKLGEIDYKTGLCPWKDVKVYPHTLVQIFRLIDNSKATRPTKGEAIEWSAHKPGCPCVSCLRVRFLIDQWGFGKKGG